MTSAPDLSALDDLSQQQNRARLQAMTQAMPLPQPVAPPGPDVGVGSFQDLQQRAAQAPLQLGQALQTQQTQFGQTQNDLERAQAQLNDPYEKIQQDLVSRYQQLGAQRHIGVKGLLQNFFGGMSHGMLPVEQTPEFQQNRILGQMIQVENARSLAGLREAQTQNLQLVTRNMPDGSQIEIPQSHVATFDAAMAKGSLANQKPDLNDLLGRTIYSAIQQGRDPNTDPVVQQLLQIHQGMQKPPADTTAQQKADFQLVTGIQNSKTIPATSKPGLISYLLANTTPASTGTQTAFKIQLEDQNKQVPVYDTKQGNSLTYLSPADINARNTVEPGRYTLAGQVAAGNKTGYAFDPKTNETVLTNPQEAAQNGYTAFRPVTEANIRNDTHDIKVLNDVAAKSNNVIRAASAMDSSERGLIARVIDAADHDDQYRLGAFGLNIPSAWLNNILNQENANALSQKGRDYLVAVLSLREASMGMQRLLTGSARSNESQIKALQATLPGGAEPDSRMVLQKMGAFTQNLQMLRQGLPRLPGSSIPIAGGQNAQPVTSFSYNPATDSLSPNPQTGDWFSQFGGRARQ